MNRHGFSLIETIIYCFVGAFIGILICQFYAISYTNFRNAQKKGQELMALYAMNDVLVRDLESANCSLNDWYAQEQLICKIQSECIGWQLRGGKLYRMIGSYDFNRNEWQKKSQALVAQNVTTFDYRVQSKDQMVSTVFITLAIGSANPLTTTINLFNRIIV